MDGLIDRLEDARRAAERDEELAEIARSRLHKLQVESTPLLGDCARHRANIEMARAQALRPTVARVSASLVKFANAHAQAEKVAAERRAAEMVVIERAERDAKLAELQASGKWAPKVGETVRVPKLGGNALVSAVNKGKVVVQVGGLAMTLKLSEVRSMSML